MLNVEVGDVRESEPRMLLKTIGLASQTEVTQVLFNCYSDSAHRNAPASDPGQLRTG